MTVIPAWERGHPGRVAGGTPAFPGHPAVRGYRVDTQPRLMADTPPGCVFYKGSFNLSCNCPGYVRPCSKASKRIPTRKANPTRAPQPAGFFSRSLIPQDLRSRPDHNPKSPPHTARRPLCSTPGEECGNHKHQPCGKQRDKPHKTLIHVQMFRIAQGDSLM